MAELMVREKNWIITAVNCRKSPEEAGLKTEAELQYYWIIWDEAQGYFDQGGIWPIFDLWELDLGKPFPMLDMAVCSAIG